jgi:hypothetical protein
MTNNEEIKIRKSQSHVITKIQFHVQLTRVKIVHKSQRLSFNELVFDLKSVTIHDLKYANLFLIRKKRNSLFNKIHYAMKISTLTNP